MLDTEVSENQLKSISMMSPPLKRAAYSDRTAWLMSLLSELAYVHFEGEHNLYLDLAQQFARLNDKKVIAARIAQLATELRNSKEDSNQKEKLRSVLKAGDFELIGVFNNAATDTQGYVAIREGKDEETAMAVVAFRGTEDINDWKRDANAELVGVALPNDPEKKIVGKLHKGFNEGFLSVKTDIEKLLSEHKNVPVYLTGHSLGGALATVATWHIAGQHLAACYTFGAPRAGNFELAQHIRTPIYRAVNANDPVPFLPPCGGTISILKTVTRAFGSLFFSGFFNILTQQLIKVQGYQHYGDIRYIKRRKNSTDSVVIIPSVGALERFLRFIANTYKNPWKDVSGSPKDHAIGEYREKLHCYTEQRQPK